MFFYNNIAQARCVFWYHYHFVKRQNATFYDITHKAFGVCVLLFPQLLGWLTI